MEELSALIKKHGLVGLTDIDRAQIANEKLRLRAMLEANPLFKLLMLNIQIEYLELVDETTEESDNIGRNSDELRYKLNKARTLNALKKYVNTDYTTTRLRS